MSRVKVVGIVACCVLLALATIVAVLLVALLPSRGFHKSSYSATCRWLGGEAKKLDAHRGNEVAMNQAHAATDKKLSEYEGSTVVWDLVVLDVHEKDGRAVIHVDDFTYPHSRDEQIARLKRISAGAQYRESEVFFVTVNVGEQGRGMNYVTAPTTPKVAAIRRGSTVRIRAKLEKISLSGPSGFAPNYSAILTLADCVIE